ncbi:MAG: cell division protein FtsQ/DivIB [Chloroflexota bacterium]
MTAPRRRIGYLVFLLSVVAGLGALTVGPTFRVRRTQVYGTLLLDPSAVVAAARLNGQNPFTVDRAAAVERVLSLGVPESATVSFALPDTAIVTIVERSPSYIWKVDSTMYLVASDGTVLGTTSRENERVIVVDSARRPVKIGKTIDVRPLREAAYLMDYLPRVAHLSPPYVVYSPDRGIIVPAANGASIAFGDDRELNLKLDDLGPTLDAAKARKPLPTLIDLQVPGHPFFR